MAITCIIVDDEEMAIEHLMGYIAKIHFLELQAQFVDPTEAINYLEKHPVDLVFLDIEMPNFAIDGMDFMKIMGSKQNYILTTAYPKSVLGNFNHLVISILNLQISLFIGLDSWKSLVHNREFRMFFGSEYRLHNIQFVIWQIPELTK